MDLSIDEINNLTKNNDELMARNERLIETLEEIREVIMQDCKDCKWNINDITCGNGDCGDGKLQIIQNRINEVLQ